MDTEGKAVTLLLLSVGRELDEGESSATVVVEGRRVALWIDSVGIWDLVFLPKERGK